MKFSTLSTYLQKIENTSATSEEIKLLSKLFLKASIREAGKIGYLVLGRLGPLYSNPGFGLGEKLMIRVIAIAFEEEKDIVGEKFEDLGDLGEVVQELAKNNQEKNLGILDVYEKLLAIAKLEGSGSQKKKVERFSSLLQSLDPLSSKYVVRIVLGSLRLGVAEKTLLAAL
ncbi:MAG: DNA ligase, partial [Patescibacteria group bacterium]